MLKLAAAAIWISAVTAGSLYLTLQWPQAAVENVEEHRIFGGLDYIRADIVSVPVLRSGAVDGYFLARLVYTARPIDMSRIGVPIEALLSDEVYSYLYDNPQIDFTDRNAIDIDGFRSGLRDAINDRVGSKLIHEVLIEQMDYLRKDEVQASSIRGPVEAPPASPVLMQ